MVADIGQDRVALQCLNSVCTLHEAALSGKKKHGSSSELHLACPSCQQSGHCPCCKLWLQQGLCVLCLMHNLSANYHDPSNTVGFKQPILSYYLLSSPHVLKAIAIFEMRYDHLRAIAAECVGSRSQRLL
jgi:hypothetical protein